jgi:hypothetical protein
MVILAERRAGTNAAMNAKSAMNNTLLNNAGQTRSTLSGTGFDDAGGTYVGWVAVMTV